MVRAKNPGNQTLAIEIPAAIKSRLKIESYRQNKHMRKIVAEILDATLPQYADVLKYQYQEAIDKENAAQNAKNGG